MDGFRQELMRENIYANLGKKSLNGKGLGKWSKNDYKKSYQIIKLRIHGRKLKCPKNVGWSDVGKFFKNKLKEPKNKIKVNPKIKQKN